MRINWCFAVKCISMRNFPWKKFDNPSIATIQAHHKTDNWRNIPSHENKVLSGIFGHMFWISMLKKNACPSHGDTALAGFRKCFCIWWSLHSYIAFWLCRRIVAYWYWILKCGWWLILVTYPVEVLVILYTRENPIKPSAWEPRENRVNSWLHSLPVWPNLVWDILNTFYIVKNILHGIIA